MNKYDKQAQSEWLNNDEPKVMRGDEIFLSVSAIALCFIGFFIIDGIADWVVGL